MPAVCTGKPAARLLGTYAHDRYVLQQGHIERLQRRDRSEPRDYACGSVVIAAVGHRVKVRAYHPARRCLVGAECEIRAFREAVLGELAETLAPQQPTGDAALLHGDGAEQLPAGQPWGRILLVAVLAALLVVGGGPIMSAARPIIDSLIGAAGASAEPSAAASDSATPLATPTATPSASVTPSPTPTATATPAPSSDSGTTYVVRKNDSLYKIACALPIGCNGYKAIAELNGIAGPEYVIKRGQVLKLP